MRIRDWSSDVCSSDLLLKLRRLLRPFSRFILLRRNRRRKRRHGAARTGYPDQPIARLHEGHRERRAALHSATRGSRTRRHSLRHLRTTPIALPRISNLDGRRFAQSGLPAATQGDRPAAFAASLGRRRPKPTYHPATQRRRGGLRGRRRTCPSCTGANRPYENRPAWKSATAWCSSCSVFITKGPYCAMGSFRGWPAISSARAGPLLSLTTPSPSF